MIDYAVIGAGPTGLTAAVELARRGGKVRIFDKKDGPSGLSRAVGVTPQSLALLTPCGAGPAIREEAVRFEGMVLHRGDDPILTLPLNFDDESSIHGLPQDRTEAHLIAALERYGVAVEYMRPLTNYHIRADHIALDFGAHVTAEARYLIGADGVHSRVRATAGIHYVGQSLPGPWSIADVIAPDWPHPDRFAGFLLPEGAVTVVVPMAPERYRVVSSLPDALASLPVPMAVARVIREASFTIEVKLAETFRKGNVFLAGDAAHAHSPVGGRGMNHGIADACDLAARLIEGRQEGYDAARRPLAEQAIAVTERARRMLQSTGASRRLLLATMAAIGRSQTAQRAIVHQVLAG